MLWIKGALAYFQVPVTNLTVGSLDLSCAEPSYERTWVQPSGWVITHYNAVRRTLESR